MKNYVKTPEQAIAYLVDCSLATVCHMAMLKSRKIGEYERQISIAQTGINWIKEFKIDAAKTRANEIIVSNISVAEWAFKYEIKK
jgi:hypothetical protein